MGLECATFDAYQGALDSAHFSSHEKNNYLVKMQQENLAHIRFRILTI
jgi:hypothetical protein